MSRIRTGQRFRLVTSLVTGLFLAAGTIGPSSGAAALTKGAVKRTTKKVVTKQINKLVPGMIDAATIDRGSIPPVAASTSDANKPVFTAGPFTISLDCSLDGGNVRLDLLVATTEENSVSDDGYGSIGDLDPVDGATIFHSYVGNPPGGDAITNYPYYDSAALLSPSGTHVYVQLDSITNFKGNHCYVDGWFYDLSDLEASARAPARIGAVRAPGSGPLSKRDVKKTAKKVANKRIKALVPSLIDDTTIDQGIISPVTASTSDADEPFLTKGPFTISLDCSLDGSDVQLQLRVRTTEPDSAVNDNSGLINGDLDPGDGDTPFLDFTGNPPGGDATTPNAYTEYVGFVSPSGTRFNVQFTTITNFTGNHCYVTGWLFDLGGDLAGRDRPSIGAVRASGSGPLSKRDVKKTAKKVANKRIKALVPSLIDDTTIDEGIIPPAAASTTDPNVPFLTKGPFTISLDCGLESGNVTLRLQVKTTEENSVVADGGYIEGDLDPGDGEQFIADDTGNPPGGDADGGNGMGYQYAVFQTASGTHFFGHFSALTNFKGNDCYVDGSVMDYVG